MVNHERLILAFHQVGDATRTEISMTSGAEVLMVIGAHAGDAEVMAGAVVVQHVHDGGKAMIVHLTLGERGHGRLS